ATLPDLRLRRWAMQRYPGGRFVHAIRILHTLWHAQGSLPRGRSMRFLCAHLQLHQDDMSNILCALKELGYVVDTEGEDADQWVLSFDQRETTMGPLIDALLLDRKQPGLSDEHLLLESISVSLTQPDVSLATLFEQEEALPESPQMVQNT